PYEIGGCGDDLADRPEGGRAGIRPRDSGQDEEVGNGNGGHFGSFRSVLPPIIVAASTMCGGRTRGSTDPPSEATASARPRFRAARPPPAGGCSPRLLHSDAASCLRYSRPYGA